MTDNKALGIGIWLLAVAGPVIALTATWKPSTDIAAIDGGSAPSLDIVEDLRTTPDDAMLDMIERVSVGTSRLGSWAGPELVAAAEAVLEGELNNGGAFYGVPESGFATAAGEGMEDLEVCSFAVPGLLIRAYETSGDLRYLEGALDYVLAWSEYEASLLIPRGLVFNDHATAARAIIVTELWKHYRDSALFDASEATELLLYVKKLSRLLLYEPLYEYRSNHGIMQSLSLLHLGLAFPLLDTAGPSVETGHDRLLSQLDYYLNREGVVLEHSPAYHHNGLLRLAAAWRYLGLLGEPVPQRFVESYRKALEFRRALLRPDLTLPPIGDTGNHAFSSLHVAVFGPGSIASAPLREEPPFLPAPERLTAAPGAGWLILWDGLAAWPDPSQLAQTVLHWGNFPTRAHKHADELGLSIWSDGVQWLRGVGYWPYGRSRIEAIGWRSANAPHWLEEPARGERVSRLAGVVVDANFAFFDVLRTNADDSRIRRQLVRIGKNTWLVVDSFRSEKRETAEIVWRFPPGVRVEQGERPDFVLRSGDAALSMRIAATVPLDVAADVSGEAGWNGGMVVDGAVTDSPAIRVTSAAADPAILTVFSSGSASADGPSWHWNGPSDWQVSLAAEQGAGVSVTRAADTLEVMAGQPGGRQGDRHYEIDYTLDQSAIAARDAAIAAFQKASRTYGTPWQPNTMRQTKVTVAIAVTAAAQFIVLAVLWLKRREWWPALTVCSLLAWIALSLYLQVAGIL